MRLFFLMLMLQALISCKEQKEISLDSEPKVEAVEVQEKPQAVDLSLIMGKFDPAQHEAFVKIEKEFADREGLYLQLETYESFKKMHAAAAAVGINLLIRSATRNFDYQRGIWERKWKANLNTENSIKDKSNALKILEYSSMPSTSRHHWGTDIDLNAFENNWFEQGEGLKLYNWMEEHAAAYGFCQVYSPKGEQRPHGYNEEKWHWSYLPIANNYYNIAKAHMKDEMISGFDGAAVAKDIGVVEKYILGINKTCTEWH